MQLRRWPRTIPEVVESLGMHMASMLVLTGMSCTERPAREVRSPGRAGHRGLIWAQERSGLKRLRWDWLFSIKLVWLRRNLEVQGLPGPFRGSSDLSDLGKESLSTLSISEKLSVGGGNLTFLESIWYALQLWFVFSLSNVPITPWK